MAGPTFPHRWTYVVDPETGWTNTGARRLMLRGKTETGIDLVAPSDLKAIYEKSAAKGEKLPVAFTVGAHPLRPCSRGNALCRWMNCRLSPACAAPRCPW